ncbi:MAG: DUF1565 domain-containing protein, partial [Spirochaetota bacterium]
TSRVAGPEKIVIDIRLPLMPVKTGILDGGVYNSQYLVLKFQPTNEKLEILYTYTTDGSEPKDPDLSSPTTRDSIVFPGRLGEEILYRVKMVPALLDTNQFGKSETLSFRVDLKAPKLPELAGFNNGKSYNHPINVTFSVMDTDATLFMSITENGEEPDNPLGESGKIITGPVNFSCPDGMEKRYQFRIAVKDMAGNYSWDNTIYTFTIDRKIPENPVVLGIPSHGVTKERVELKVIPSSPEDTIYFELWTDSDVKRPGISSSIYKNPIILSGETGREVNYNFSVLSVDKAGNEGFKPDFYSFIIDRQPPVTIPAPRIHRKDAERNSAVLSWSIDSGFELYFKSTSKDSDSAVFRLYLTPVTLAIPAEGLKLYYYVQDPAGNRSTIETFTIEPPVVATSILRGIKNNQVYNSTQVLENITTHGLLRYEAAADDAAIKRVSNFSPIMPSILKFDSAEGETVRFVLKTKRYIDESDTAGEEEHEISFTIDKTPPPPPVLSGLDNKGTYQDNVTFTLHGEEGKIFYAVWENTADTKEDKFQLYSAPVILTADINTQKSYLVTAYAVDQAGNKSQNIPPVKVEIDKANIYVATIGNDYYSGTREKPFKTIQKALNYVSESGRKTICVGKGIYYLDNPIVLNDDITFIGGFEHLTWAQTNDEMLTRLEPGTYFPQGSPFISVLSGKP